MTGTCASSLWRRTMFHSFCCKYGGVGNRPHRVVQCTLRRLIEQAGTTQTWSATSLSSTCVQKNTEAAPGVRCAILDVVSWFPGVLQLWIDVSVRCPHPETLQRKCVETRSG